MFHNAIAYQLFERLTDKIENNISSKSVSIMGYSKSVIKSRLLQEFCYLELTILSVICRHVIESAIRKTILMLALLSLAGLYMT